MPDTVSFRGN